MHMEYEEELSAAPEEENVYDDYELYVALSSYDGRSLTVWKKAPGGMEERIQLKAPSRQLGKRVAFYEDDLIQITESTTSFGGWWKGSLNGVVGIFPSCLLESLDSTLPTLDTLEDTMASMDSMLANLSSSSSVMKAIMSITPRSGEIEIEKLADRLEHVADTTAVPDVEEVERIATIAPEDSSPRDEEAGAPSAEPSPQVGAKDEDQTPPPADATVARSSSEKKARVVRPASLRISKGDGTVVTKALSPTGPLSPSKDRSDISPAATSSIRSIRTIKVVQGNPSTPSQRGRPVKLSVARPMAPRSASAGVRVMRGPVRNPVVIRGAKPRNSMTEVMVTGNSPKSTPPTALLSPRKKAAAPLGARKRITADEDMPLAPPPEMELRSRAMLEEDSPLGPPPEDLPLSPERGDSQEQELRATGKEGREDGSQTTPEEEGNVDDEEEDMDDLPDVERTIRRPDEPAPQPPPFEAVGIESPRLVERIPVVQKSPRGSRFSLDLAVVSERMKTVKEDVFKPITPGTRARLHSLPKPDEPAPQCPFDYDPYEDSYVQEGDDGIDHFEDSSDDAKGETPRDGDKRRVQVADPKATNAKEGELATSIEGDPPVQLRAKTKKRLHEKAQRKQAKGAHRLSRASSAPYVKEPTEAMKIAAASPLGEASATPKRSFSSMKAEEVAAVNTENVQLRPRVKKALGAKKKRRVPQGQRRPAAAVEKEASTEEGAPKSAAEMRRYNFFEVVATERSYIKAMEQLVQVMSGLLEIQRKLTEAGDTGASLPAELQTLHVSATIILGYSRKTLEMMEPRLQTYSDQTCIGDIFLLVADFLKIYTQYVRGYEPFVNKFLIARQKNKLLREQVEKYEMSVGSFITFESHLIVPVQRIPRYSMLLKDMLKHTDEEHPDYHLLAEAVRKIERVADFVNARQTVYENLNKVIELEKKYGKQLTEQTGISQFVRSHRRVIKEANLLLCSSDSKPRRVQVSLLNDLMVVGTAPRQSTIMNWGGCKLLNVVCLWLVNHKNVTDVAGRQHCFELVMEATSESVLVLKCSSEEEKRDWMDELAAVKKMLNKAINVGAKTAEQKKRISIALNVKWTSPAIPQEIAMALAEEQAQRRQQANIQMMPIAQGSSDYARITELPSEITNALRCESNKRSGKRRTARGSSSESGDDQSLDDSTSRDSVVQQPPERPRCAASMAPDRARSPISSRTKKAKGAAKLRKTLSPLSRHKDGSSKSSGRRAGTLRGRERAAAMEDKEDKGPVSPRSLKIAKDSTASPWSPKMLKIRLGKSKDKGEEKGDSRQEKKREREEKVEKRRKEEKRKEEKEDRKREEKQEKKKEKRAKEMAKLTLDPSALAPAGMRSGLSPRSEKVPTFSKKGTSKKKQGRGKGHSRSNSVESRTDVPVAVATLRDASQKPRTRRSVSMSDMGNGPSTSTAAMFSKSTGAVTAAAASNASRKGTMPKRGKSKDTLTKKKKKRPKLDLLPGSSNSLNKSS